VRDLKVEQDPEMLTKLDGIFPSEEEFIDRPPWRVNLSNSLNHRREVAAIQKEVNTPFVVTMN